MAEKTKTDQRSVQNQLRAALKSLEQMSTRRDLDNLARFGITATRPFGVSMANLKVLAKRVGPHHELAAALWDTDRYEARMLATLIDEPARVSPAQMERWCRDFDNWGICDTACFVLFDRTPHAWDKITEWSGRRREFEKRAAFALLACLALHDKDATDDRFLSALAVVERESSDERRMVTKAISMALKAVGKRNAALRGATLEAALRMADQPSGPARSIGRGALRELGHG